MAFRIITGAIILGVIIGISGRFFEAPFLRARGFLLVSEGLYHIFFTGEERVGKTCFLLTKVIGSTIPPSPPPFFPQLAYTTNIFNHEDRKRSDDDHHHLRAAFVGIIQDAFGFSLLSIPNHHSYRDITTNTHDSEKDFGTGKRARKRG